MLLKKSENHKNNVRGLEENNMQSDYVFISTI